MTPYAPVPIRMVRTPILGLDIPQSHSDARSAAMGQATSPSSGGLLAPLIVGGIEAALILASVGASAYHGYKRNHSVGWSVWWGFMGLLFPIVTPAVAIAQGFGKREKK